MANTNFPTDGTLGVRLGDVHTSPQHALGRTFHGANGQKWIYIKANGTVAQYDCVSIDEAFGIDALTKALADQKNGIGFAQIAFTVNQYGWVCVESGGIGAQVNVLASCVQDVPLYTSATAGKLDDASASQTLISGVAITATVGGATTPAVFRATNPHIA